MNPSDTVNSLHVFDSSLNFAVWKSWYIILVKGRRCGNSLAMISRSLCLDTALNMFCISKDTKALVGSFPFDSGVEMYFSTPKRMVWTMVEIPPCTPIA